MNFSPIVIVGGEPQSISSSEILLKSIKNSSSYHFSFFKKFVNQNIKKFNYSIDIFQLNKDFTNIKKMKLI